MKYGATSILSRFRSCQGSVELFALEGKEALDLLASNPLAGFCLAVNWQFTKRAKFWPLAAARAMMNKPQRDILAWLGFSPGTEGVAKIGRKCVPESLTLDRCLRLRRTVSHDRHRHLLAHLSRVNAGVIALMSERDLQPLLTPRLLFEVAENPIEDTRPECQAFLADIRQMWRETRRDERQPSLMSLKHVRALHDELIKEINRKGVRWFRGRIYPPPPLPGITTNDLIVTPITNVDDLQALGRAQHNCVASYARRVLAGNTYIYRVTAGGGHVCTMCLVKARNGHWRVAEFRGVCNRPAPPETIGPLHRWLSSTQQVSHAGKDSDQVAPFPEAEQMPVFPSPPFHGHVGGGMEIVPLRDPQMLSACGGEIVRHQAQIETGRACAYRVVTPTDRCVMVIARNRGLFWRIKEIRSESGTPLRGDTLSTIADWLNTAQGRFR